MKLLAAAALVAVAGCGRHAAAATAGAGAAAAAPIATARLRNATYRLAFDPTRTLHLVNGAATDGSELEGTMVVSTTMLDSIARGTLPDGRASAAVVLVTEAGGTGSFYDLALVADSSGTLTDLATVGLGDRIVLKAIRLNGDSVTVTLLTQGPKDPMCCPTLEVTRHFALDGGRLLPTERAPAADSR
ncbi:MAG TPA: hypothetical protein VFI39_04045 [Gemmatimonadales bacterium]|nr:hypothetical protein [Gemmatimonadales bacterium]